MCLSGIAASCNTCDALSFSKSISTVLMMPQDDGERMNEWCSRHDARVHHASRTTPGWEGRVRRGGFGTHPYEMPGCGCGGHPYLTSGKMPGIERAPISPPFCHLCIHPHPVRCQSAGVEQRYIQHIRAHPPDLCLCIFRRLSPRFRKSGFGYSRITTLPMPCGDAQDQSSLDIRATTCTTDTADTRMFNTWRLRPLHQPYPVSQRQSMSSSLHHYTSF